eukprot:5227133-Prymnesium_polylepis.1
MDKTIEDAIREFINLERMAPERQRSRSRSISHLSTERLLVKPREDISGDPDVAKAMRVAWHKRSAAVCDLAAACRQARGAAVAITPRAPPFAPRGDP